MYHTLIYDLHDYSNKAIDTKSKPSDDSFRRDEIAIMVARLTPSPSPTHVTIFRF